MSNATQDAIMKPDANGAQASSTALARVVPNDNDAFRMALEPRDVKDVYQLCASLAKTGVCGIKSPEEALIRIMTGRALGIPSMVAMQHVYDVYGRPSLSAKLKVALCLRHPDCEYFEHVSSDAKQATYKAKRRGKDEKVIQFTIDQAVTAGLVKKDSNYEKWPKRMCEARASSHLADLVFPDATMGMPTREDSEELEGEVVTGGAGALAVQMTAPVQAPAVRNFEGEAAAIKDRVRSAKTDDEKKAVRAEISRFVKDAPGFERELKEFYSATHAAPKAQPKPQPAPAASNGYVPPAQRGDSYEGPEEPEPPFGAS